MKKICQAMEVSRSNIYEQLKKDHISSKRERRNPSDQEILALIRQLTDERPTYGYRRITALLRKKLNQAINAKRVYRLIKAHGLLLQRYGNRPIRVHDGKVITLKSNVRWCSDHFSIQCWNAEQVHIAFALDCHDREVISLSIENLIQEINHFLICYYSSPVKNKSNKRIKQKFWTDESIQKLPYLKGFVFALLIDGIIKVRTHHHYGLDDVIRELFKVSQRSNQKFSFLLFKNIIQQISNYNIDSYLHKYIEEGETISLDELYPYLPLSNQNIYPFSLGFSLEDLVVAAWFSPEKQSF